MPETFALSESAVAVLRFRAIATDRAGAIRAARREQSVGGGSGVAAPSAGW